MKVGLESKAGKWSDKSIGGQQMKTGPSKDHSWHFKPAEPGDSEGKQGEVPGKVTWLFCTQRDNFLKGCSGLTQVWIGDVSEDSGTLGPLLWCL